MVYKTNNPYKPGAGRIPSFLAGRDTEIKYAEMVLEAMKNNQSMRSLIYIGLHGVGKTVLLNSIEEIADDKDIIYEHIEADSKVDFITQLIAISQVLARKVSVREKARKFIDSIMEAVKCLSVSFDTEGSLTFSISDRERELYKVNDLGKSLTDVIVALGKAAKASETPIVIFLDEIQYLKKEQISALAAALHRANQLSCPITVIGAGLPQTRRLFGDAKSYSERLFEYREIGNLDEAAARDAIVEPLNGNVRIDDVVVAEIIGMTEGYPYFIQEICNILFDISEEAITLDSMDEAKQMYFKRLDEGFYRVRYERCSKREQEFISAMIECGELPCTISNIAENMNSTVKQISVFRAGLISKGVIFSTSHAKLDFTVPKFAEFVRRHHKEENIYDFL